MSLRFVARLAAFVTGLLVLVTSPAPAKILDFAGALPITLQLGSERLDFPLAGGGAVIVNPSDPGLHLTAVSVPAGAMALTALVAPVTDPGAFPIAGIQVTAVNGSGRFSNASGRLRGSMPLVGAAKVCLFGACSAAVANLNVPLAEIGQGGTVVVTGAVNLTVQGAPWTTGTVDVGAATIMGGAHGPASATSSTAQLGADLNLVTPIFISSNIGVISVWPSFARLGLSLGSVAQIECADGLDNDGDGLADFPDDPGCTRAVDASERQSGHVCDDGVDNDGDGFADFPADNGCSSVLDTTEAGDCQDGIDNDGDGRIDFPNDTGCTTASDLSERESGLVCDDGVDNDGDGAIDYPLDPGCSSPLDASETGDCQNGIDDDGDGLIDFPADPGCTNASDGSEREASHVCDDGIDNDHDGAADYPADPGCSSALDDTETTQLACEDGVDNDGDGLTDFPADPGCASIFDDSERGAVFACDDGIDNDADGVADFPGDTGCVGPTDDSELGACQDGIDNDGDTLTDFPADAGCTSALDLSEREANHLCDDGIDNDQDGAIDYPADPGCSSVLDETESSQLACDDGLDNDGDGVKDFPADPGCASSLDDSERGPSYACDDGVDNDGDFVADFPSDHGCTGPTDTSEIGACQDGLDNDADGLVDFPADPDCVDANDPREGPAGPVDFVGQLPITIGFGGGPLDFSLQGVGVAILNPSDPSLHLASASVPANVLTAQHAVVPVTDPAVFPVVGLQLTAANGFGRFDIASGRLRGTMPLVGTAKVCLFGPCSAAVTNLNLPLSKVGLGGTALVTGAVNLTLKGAPWTTGTVDVGAETIRGGAHGPASATSSTAQLGGDVNLVTPIFISSNIGASQVLPSFARLGLSFGGLALIDCADGLDNDGDGLIDFPDDPGCTRALDLSEHESGHVCDDGLDNDHDGVADFPADPGCSNVADSSEATACQDGLDNDGDGLVDFPTDPGCTSANDASEQEPSHVCDDGIDNDADGRIDYPADRGCNDANDRSETSDCSDGLDNDGDGLVDEDDPGCPFPEATLENPKCDDGIDNDGDGLVDFDDPLCSRAWPYTEGPACGLGTELTLVMPLVSLLWRRRRRA